MQVRQVMTAGVECVGPDATLQEAAKKMRDRDIGPLPVCDNDRLAGVVTDRDITVRATAEGLDPKKTRVKDVLSPEVIYCYDDDDIQAASRIMQEKQVRRILVLNRAKRLVGIVSLGDVATETVDRDLSGKTLERVSQ